MTPVDLYVIRHAESEGNVAERTGGAYADRVRARPHWLWRLSPEGRVQAERCGTWLRDELADRPVVAVTSPHLRAMETAALLAVSDAWEIDPDLREREWGEWDSLNLERQRRELDIQRAHPFDWRPPGGESLAALTRRVTAPLLRLSVAPAAAVLVSHADTIRALRYVLTGLTPVAFDAEYRSEPLPNAAVLHLSRRDPDTGMLASAFAWHREHRPWDAVTPPLVALLPRRWLTAADLLARVAQVDPVPVNP